MNKLQLQQILNDKQFLKKILTCKNLEEIREEFKNREIDLTLEEVDNLCESLAALFKYNIELVESDLEKVSGGVHLNSDLFSLQSQNIINNLKIINSQINKNDSFIYKKYLNSKINI